MFLERRPKFGWGYLFTPSTSLFTPFVWIILDFLVSVYLGSVLVVFVLIFSFPSY